MHSSEPRLAHLHKAGKMLDTTKNQNRNTMYIIGHYLQVVDYETTQNTFGEFGEQENMDNESDKHASNMHWNMFFWGGNGSVE